MLKALPTSPLQVARATTRWFGSALPVGCAFGLLSCLLAPPAFAGDLTVQSTGAPVTVVRGDAVVGTTPLTLTGLPEGPVDVGFRESALGATVFTQRVAVPAIGGVTVEVDLPQRVARTVLPPAPASAAPAAPPPPAAPAGDIYVSSTPPGATVWVDGAATTFTTPAMVRGLSVGKHTVQARTECARAQADAAVANGVITRTELMLVTGKGAVTLSGTPVGARVLVDGVEAGAIPTTLKDLSCGEHQVAVRAPGYLEDTRTVRVPAYESTPLAVMLRKEEFGTLVVDLSPLEAQLLVDTIDLGPGPRTVERIAVGTHRVEGRLDGYMPIQQDVTITANTVSRLDLALTVVPAPLPTTTPEVVQRDPRPWARIAANSVVSAAAVGAGAMSFARYQHARSAYDTYAAIESETEAEAYFTENVVPPRTQAAVLGIGALLGIGGATALWVTTDF